MNRLYALPLFALVVFAGCSSDDVKPDGGTDSGGGKDTGANDTGTQDTGVQDTGVQDSGTDTGVVDAGFMLNGCTDMSFVDKTSGNQSVRTVNWDLSQSFPYCFIISKNQTFVWNTTVNLTFANHPLEGAGGDANNPITVTNMGTTASFAFPNTGNYGFHCQFHPGIMQGVIRVKN